MKLIGVKTKTGKQDLFGDLFKIYLGFIQDLLLLSVSHVGVIGRQNIIDPGTTWGVEAQTLTVKKSTCIF